MLEPSKVGIAVGGTFAFVHVVWILVVLAGLGQEWISFATSMHFVSTTMTALPFDLGTAVWVTVTASIMGFIVGYVFASIWNRVER